MRRILGILAIAILLVAILPSTAFALTTADIAVTATPQSISISVNPTVYDFAEVATSSTPSSNTTYFTLTNTSNVQTDQTISTNDTVWTGGVHWDHDDTATPGADTAGLKTNRGGAWGVGDVIIKNAAPNYVYEDCPAVTNYYFGIKLWAPTSFTDAVEKAITVRVTAVAG